MLPLSYARENKIYRVKENLCPPQSRNVLEDLGITEGAQIYVISTCLGSVVIKVDGKEVALSKELADGIKI